MKNPITIVWLEQDLRLSDNPAIQTIKDCKNVLPIFILDNVNAGEHALGAASRWWLHHSLSSLNQSLSGALNFYQGDALKVFTDLCSRFEIKSVYWNRRYEPWRIHRDKQLKSQLKSLNIHAKSFNGSLINEPWEVLKKDGTPYKVFTPYYRQAAVKASTQSPLPTSEITNLLKDNDSKKLEDLNLLPKKDWDKGFYQHWSPGEAGARKALDIFFDQSITNYKTGRDFPSRASVSRLSPHLHFGEISPKQINHAVSFLEQNDNTEHFSRELCWREFSYYLLYHFPDLPEKNLKEKFNHFPWQNNAEWLKCWQQGQTGYPIVDAGMRELWQTGYMHNRVRMVVASFLVKNLLIDWRLGAQWFWDCLLDADLANNSASWQWVAGCGSDAAPYFRIFNPVTQGEKFDPDGSYTKRFVPELKLLPNKYLFKPWLAPKDILYQAKVQLGVNYPLPIVDIKESREIALNAYKYSQSGY